MLKDIKSELEKKKIVKINTDVYFFKLVQVHFRYATRLKEVSMLKCEYY